MNFEELLDSEITNLPKTRSTGGDFEKFVTEFLYGYLDEIEKSSGLYSTSGYERFNPAIFKKRLHALIDGILKSIKLYLDGKPEKAYVALEKGLKMANIMGYIKYHSNYEPGENFYRIRVKPDSFAFQRSELFHIPFELRGRVKTQRYSIPGFPSLYLTNSIYVAWEELKRCNISEIQAVRLQNTVPLKLINLTTERYNSRLRPFILEKHQWTELYDAIIWPLAAVCSIKVQSPQDTFKPEYIIPQLLLQWISEKDIDGIAYSSTHIRLDEWNSFGLFHNYVFPVKEVRASGQCSVLKQKFTMTEVLPMNILDIASFGGTLYGTESISTDLNKAIESIEMVKGYPQPYSTTRLAELEFALTKLPCNELL